MRRLRTTRALLIALAVVGSVIAIDTAAAPSFAAQTTASGDAHITFDGAATSWTLETASVKRTVRFENGTFLQTSLVNKATGREYQQDGVSSEFRVQVGSTDYRGSTAGWSYDSYSTQVQENGAISLSIKLHNDVIGITRAYSLYPDTSFIEERTDVTNRTQNALSVNNYSAVSMRVLGNDADDVDFYYMSGDKASGTYNQLKGPIPMASGLQNPGGRGANANQEFLTLRDRTADEGLVTTWDYTGNWVMNVGDSYGKILVEPRATIATSIAAGQTLLGPLGRTGFYEGDLDAMGNAILDFTYRYLWDHTSEKYFPLIRYGGYGSDPATISAKINQLAYIGGDMVWMDDGWQDTMGDWNAKAGEPLAEYRDYAAMHGEQVGYWLVPWGAEQTSKVATEHPDWMINPADRKAGLDTTKPDVVQHIDATLQQRESTFGPFMLKTDFGADSGNIEKANATMTILRNFVNHNPEASLQLCSDGGGLLNLSTVALSNLALLRDGTGGAEEGYWTSMLFPSEKLIMSYGRGNVGSYSPSNRHLLSFHLTIAGDATAGQEALEPLRVDAELYRYLNSQGVMGRWVKVFRPTVSNGSAIGILQKMSGDDKRGYITFPKAAFPIGSSVTLYPKGLNPAQSYTVASQEGSVGTTTKTGTQWMADGVTLSSYVEGEVLYFNLETRPGSGTDHIKPTVPKDVKTALGTHLGSSGVDVTWSPAADDNWLSYYQVFKNGAPITKVSTGQYFFDAGGTTSDVYTVSAVDGDGNTSALAGVEGTDESQGGDGPSEPEAPATPGQDDPASPVQANSHSTPSHLANTGTSVPLGITIGILLTLCGITSSLVLRRKRRPELC